MEIEHTRESEAAAYRSRSHQYWQQAREHLELGHMEKAAELAWGSTAERVKALALLRTGTPVHSHKAIRNYVRRMASELADRDLYEGFRQAESLHIEFYESQFDLDEVEAAFAAIDKLLRKLDSYMAAGRAQ